MNVKAKKIKEKFQISKKIFVFVFAFARCENALRLVFNSPKATGLFQLN